MGRRALRSHLGRRLCHGGPHSARHLPDRRGRRPVGMAGALLHRGCRPVYLCRGGRGCRVATQPGGGGHDLRRESGRFGRRGSPGRAAASPRRVGRNHSLGRRAGSGGDGDRRSPAPSHRSRPGGCRPLRRGHGRHPGRTPASPSTRSWPRPSNVPTPAASIPNSPPIHAWTFSKTPDSARPPA